MKPRACDPALKTFGKAGSSFLQSGRLWVCGTVVVVDFSVVRGCGPVRDWSFFAGWAGACGCLQGRLSHALGSLDVGFRRGRRRCNRARGQQTSVARGQRESAGCERRAGRRTRVSDRIGHGGAGRAVDMGARGHDILPFNCVGRTMRRRRVRGRRTRAARRAPLLAGDARGGINVLFQGVFRLNLHTLRRALTPRTTQAGNGAHLVNIMASANEIIDRARRGLCARLLIQSRHQVRRVPDQRAVSDARR